MPASRRMPIGEEQRFLECFMLQRNRCFVVTPANGQVRRQVSDSAGSAGWTNPASACTIAMIEGVFDSFHMQVSGSGSAFKAERPRCPAEQSPAGANDGL